jgi:hypothetical protein
MKDVYSIKYSVGDLIYNTSTKEFALVTFTGQTPKNNNEFIKIYFYNQDHQSAYFSNDISKWIKERAFEHYPLANQ